MCRKKDDGKLLPTGKSVMLAFSLNVSNHFKWNYIKKTWYKCIDIHTMNNLMSILMRTDYIQCGNDNKLEQFSPDETFFFFSHFDLFSFAVCYSAQIRCIYCKRLIKETGIHVIYHKFGHTLNQIANLLCVITAVAIMVYVLFAFFFLSLLLFSK